MNISINELKKQLVAAVLSVVISLVALSSATYAWYVSNNIVDATTSTIAAKTNSFVLQIAKLSEGAQHGENATSLSASTVGGEITPASTDDVTGDWYVCNKWGQDGKVYSYYTPSDLNEKGKYTVAGIDHYAYLKSEYILYTVMQTGICDVYLAPDDLGKAITITQTSGEESRTVPGSIRLGITIQPMNEMGQSPIGTEELVLVYAPENETGKGNDKNAVDGWSCVADTSSLKTVSYPYVYGTNYIALNGKNYAATKVGENYTTPESNGKTIASNVGYNGVCMRVYIWLEGTDAECINTSGEDEFSIYDVTVSLAGVAK